MRLLIGTGNLGKLSEITTVLGDLPYQIFSLESFADLFTPNEDGSSYEENAIIKATSYAKQTGLLTLADDSGLEVEALAGAPGVQSARYAGVGASDAERRALLLSNLSEAGIGSGRARFVCVVALADATGAVINLSEGVCTGRMIGGERGHGGFGYDPLFVPEGYDRTFAELDASIKNKISHRGRALAKVRDFLLTMREAQ